MSGQTSNEETLAEEILKDKIQYNPALAEMLIPKNNYVSKRQKYWIYMLSVGFPGIGFIFSLFYFFSDKDDARSVAWWCIGLTVFSLLATIFFFRVMLSTAGTSVDQLQQIKQSDVLQLLQ